MWHDGSSCSPMFGYQDDQGKRWERQIGGSLESEDGDINHTV